MAGGLFPLICLSHFPFGTLYILISPPLVVFVGRKMKKKIVQFSLMSFYGKLKRANLCAHRIKIGMMENCDVNVANHMTMVFYVCVCVFIFVLCGICPTRHYKILSILAFSLCLLRFLIFIFNFIYFVF